jgi:hypothetical protein
MNLCFVYGISYENLLKITTQEVSKNGCREHHEIFQSATPKKSYMHVVIIYEANRSLMVLPCVVIEH